MKSLFGRTGARFIRDLLSPSRGKTPASEPCRVQSPANGRKILIVDDDIVFLKALTLKLESRRYGVATAVDGADAIRAVRDENPDLVLLDIHFPPDIAHGGGVPWDGFLLMRWLRGIENVGKVPVLFITGEDPGDYRDRALECGAAGLFHKSQEPEVLISMIERALNGLPSEALLAKEGTGSPDQLGLGANFQI